MVFEKFYDTEENDASIIPHESQNSLANKDSNELKAEIGLANFYIRSNQPKIAITCKNFRNYCYLMVDSSVNLIKTGMLKNTPIDIKDTFTLKGITKNALGFTTFEIMNRITKFYIVDKVN